METIHCSHRQSAVRVFDSSPVSIVLMDAMVKQEAVIAESNVTTNGRAIDFYRPNDEINAFPVIGVVEATGAISYKDARTNLHRVIEEHFTDGGSMGSLGFATRIRGLIVPDRLPAGIYESWREGVFIFYRTPQEITDTIPAYETPKQPQTITFPALPEKKAGDPDFVPGAMARSGLTVSYASPDPDVAMNPDFPIRANSTRQFYRVAA